MTFAIFLCPTSCYYFLTLKYIYKEQLSYLEENSYGFVRLSQGCKCKRLAKALVLKAQSFGCLMIWQFVVLGFMCSACKRLYHLVPTYMYHCILGGFIEFHQSRLVLASINGELSSKLRRTLKLLSFV